VMIRQLRVRPTLSRDEQPELNSHGTLRWIASLIVWTTLGVLVAEAELLWETKEIVQSATAGDDGLVSRFKFKNTGTTRITIIGVHASCHCTTAEPSTSIIEPGESGHIQTVFHLGDRLGAQVKTIDVTTDDASDRPVSLVLRVKINELVVCNPRILVWPVGTAKTAKTVEFAPAGSQRLLMISPPAETPGFTCDLESAGADNKFRLRFTPLSTDVPATGIFRCTAQVEGKPQVGLIVYALVKAN